MKEKPLSGELDVFKIVVEIGEDGLWCYRDLEIDWPRFRKMVANVPRSQIMESLKKSFLEWMTKEGIPESVAEGIVDEVQEMLNQEEKLRNSGLSGGMFS
jgi:hypothetical protein